MYQTARMLAIALSRSALAVCITRLAIRSFHQRHQPADEQRDHRIEQRHRQAGGEHRREPALRLAYEMPIESEQALRRRARPRTGRATDTRLEKLQDYRQHTRFSAE